MTENPKKELIPDVDDQCWIEGFELAIEEVQDILDEYKEEKGAENFETVKNFVCYMTEKLLRMRDGLINEILEEYA
jgi:hypothetical protein